MVFLGVNYFSSDLLKLEQSRLIYLPKALPILLAALWFHFMIPVVAKLNDYNRNNCKKIFSIGLAIPIVLYILWVGLMLSLIPLDGNGNTFTKLISNNESVGNMINYATHNNPKLPQLLKILLNLFSNVAMLTSFLTVGISTYDYIRDALKIKQTKMGIFENLAITMLPPAFFALFYPDGFVFILQQAIILLMLINLFMLACCIKKYDDLENKPKKYVIWLLVFMIVVMIAIQFADNMNLLPSL